MDDSILKKFCMFLLGMNKGDLRVEPRMGVNMYLWTKLQKKKKKKKTNKLLKWKSGDTLINRCKKPHKIGKEKGNLDENPLKNMKHEIDTILQFNIKL